MEKLNNSTDLEKYIESGKLTGPFLQDDFVLKKVLSDFQNNHENGEPSLLMSLCRWIHHNVRYSNDARFRGDKRFQRCAKEIWESKLTTGCTDYAILFATFARQMKIPTTFLHTAEAGWLENLKSKGNFTMHVGHSFCECYYNGNWVLVDPTNGKVEKEYNPQKIVLSYNVGNHNVYVPYFRGLDLGKRQSTKEHNVYMDEVCLKL